MKLKKEVATASEFVNTVTEAAEAQIQSLHLQFEDKIEQEKAQMKQQLLEDVEKDKAMMKKWLLEDAEKDKAMMRKQLLEDTEKDKAQLKTQLLELSDTQIIQTMQQLEAQRVENSRLEATNQKLSEQLKQCQSTNNQVKQKTTKSNFCCRRLNKRMLLSRFN